MNDLISIKRALISVSDKTDLIALAKKLDAHGVQIISTGGTAKAIAQAGITVTTVDQVTGFPEMMDGRIKTLHPRIHGGLLALRDNDNHVAAMTEHDIVPIDLVCVNLYPFEATIAKDNVTDAQAIEQIDIGGPSMIRSGAKNHRFVTVVTDVSQYDELCRDMDQHDGATTLALRNKLAAAAFARTAAYDTTIAMWMSRSFGGSMPDTLTLRYAKHSLDLKYGENPHQKAVLYVDRQCDEVSVARASIVHGAAPGFCNYFDADGALELIKEIDPQSHAAVAIIKHANPCGFAIADNLPTAFTKAYDGDPLAAFGGIVALNRTVDLATAEAICEGKKLLHLIIAPAYDRDALAMLAGRWKDVRILETGPLPTPSERSNTEIALRQITGGLLVQDRDVAVFDQPDLWKHMAGPQPDTDTLAEASLAMICVKHLKSNAVCIVRDQMLVGGGMGQVDRLASCRLAVERAGERAKGAVAGSDALFPFRDGPDQLIAAGVKAIVQPGGSKHDDETITACEDASVTLLFTGQRHFRH